MTVSLYDPASLAVAGDDQFLCNQSVFIMDADSASFGVGTWSKLFGPSAGSFADSSNAKTTFTGADPGIYVFQWTVANGDCSNADQVRFTNYAEPSDADAGPDQSQICGDEAVMDANLPNVGLGEWSLLSKPAGAPDPTITAIIQPTTTITNMVPLSYPGTFSYIWTISNGTCPVKTDTVDLTVYENPTIADAGPDQVFCDQSSTTLDGNTIVIGSGVWSLVSKPAGAADPTIVTPADPQTQITGLDYGTYVFEWTSTRLVCTSSDQVSVTNYETPTVADASGTTTSLCLYETVVLTGNDPLVGTGFWTQVSGSAVIILNPDSSQTNVVGAMDGVYEFAWTISNGPCTISSDTILITIFQNIPVVTQSVLWVCFIFVIH
jgi:hypothetical protein